MFESVITLSYNLSLNFFNLNHMYDNLIPFYFQFIICFFFKDHSKVLFSFFEYANYDQKCNF